MNKLKSNITGIGNTVEMTFFHVENKLLRREEITKQDELLEHYRHDIKKSIAAMKYLSRQMNTIGRRHWKHLFASSIRSAEVFMDLIGEQSLQFKGIEEYYDEFDKWQAEQEIPRVHPKERQFLIPSVNQELCNYVMTMKKLASEVLSDWDHYSESLKLRINEMIGYLKGILKVIKKRNHKKEKRDLVNKKAQKYLLKTVPLEPKEQSKLDSLQSELNRVDDIFQKIDYKVKTILPHAFLFLEEFIDGVTKACICKQLEMYKAFYKTLFYFGSFHGYLDLDSDGKVQSYDSIIEAWELGITDTRSKIESIINTMQKNTKEIPDEEIDDKEHIQKPDKLLRKVKFKMNDKSYRVKAKDKVNGVFADYLVEDPLKAFIKYQNVDMFRSETYFPSRVIESDVVASEQNTQVDNKPPLPPRPSLAAQNIAEVPPSLPYQSPYDSNKLFDRDFNPNLSSSSSSLSDNIDANNTDLEEESNASDTVSSGSDSTLSSLPTSAFNSTSADHTEQTLMKLYNIAKNDIKECPVPDISTFNVSDSTMFHLVDIPSVSYKLEKWNDFFNKVLQNAESKNSSSRIVRAKHDFDGKEPGDLYFRQNDELEVLFDFQKSKALYSPKGDNWMVAMAKNDTNNRIGFAPGNYLD